MDDEFELLHDQDGPPPPGRRPAWVLIGGLVAVVLLALVGVVWMVTSVSGRGGTVSAAATGTTSAPPVTAPPTATVAATTGPPAPTTPPVTTVPVPTATFTVPVLPPPSAATVAPTTKPAPKPTVSRPGPKPTPPGGKLVPVPDVTGLRVKAAVAVIRGAGFKVQVLGGVQSPDRDDRRVTAQRPTAGSTARAGSTVILVTDGL